MQIFYLFFLLFLFTFFLPQVKLDSKIGATYSTKILQSYSIIFIVALFFGLRSIEIGVDSKTYLEWFRDGGEYIKDGGEPGFRLLIRFLHNCLYGDKSFLFTMSLLIVFFDFLFYYKIDKEHCCLYIVLMACFYYFYIFHLSMYRQAIAIGIVDIAYLEFRRKHFKKYVLIGLFAITIHYTALIFVFFPIFNFIAVHIKTRRQHFFLFILMLILFATPALKFVMQMIPDFAYPIKVFKTYVLCLDLGSVHITHSHLFSIMIMLFANRNFSNIKKTKYFDIYMFHSVYFTFISLFQSSILVYDRFYFYIQLFEPLLIFQFYNTFKEKKLSKYVICSILFLYSLFTIFIWGPRNLISPYYF